MLFLRSKTRAYNTSNGFPKKYRSRALLGCYLGHVSWVSSGKDDFWMLLLERWSLLYGKFPSPSFIVPCFLRSSAGGRCGISSERCCALPHARVCHADTQVFFCLTFGAVDLATEKERDRYRFRCTYRSRSRVCPRGLPGNAVVASGSWGRDAGRWGGIIANTFNLHHCQYLHVAASGILTNTLSLHHCWKRRDGTSEV